MTPVPQEAIPKRDWIKPLMGAFVCFLLFRVALFFIYPMIEFLGGRLMGITLGMLLSAAISSALAMAIFESRRFTDLGLHWQQGSGRNLATGLALGVVAAAAVILVPLAFGMAHFTSLAKPDVSWRGDLFLPVLLLCGAMAEELAFRGFVLQYLARGWEHGLRSSAPARCSASCTTTTPAPPGSATSIPASSASFSATPSSARTTSGSRSAYISGGI